jgi:hypothetical protein
MVFFVAFDGLRDDLFDGAERNLLRPLWKMSEIG